MSGPGEGNEASGVSQFAICNLQFAIVCVALFVSASTCAASEPTRAAEARREQQRTQLLEEMRTLARATKVRYQTGDRQPKLVDTPVFRYDDQPRRFLDATLWVWTDNDRPVAFEKIEAMARDRPQWATLFTSVASGPLLVEWDEGRAYRSTSPGVEFSPLPDAPEPPLADTARKFAARRLAREFSARIITGVGPEVSEEMRLLPTPIFEYADSESKKLQGAVFGLTTSGANPDVLVLLEIRDSDRRPAWHYGVARMTTCGVTLKYRDTTVWKVDFCRPPASVFPTWTVFYIERQEPTAPETAK